jgi:hypothetical protein
MDSLLIIATLFNGLGVIISFYANYLVGFSKDQSKIFFFNAVFSALIIIGSGLIQSWPTVILNIMWLGLSFLGVSQLSLKKRGHFFKLSLYVTTVFALYAIFQGDDILAGYFTVFIFIVSFGVFSLKGMSNLEYLWWSTVGTLLFLPHLLTLNNYVIFAKESISLFIGFASMVPLYRAMYKSKLAGID